MVNDGGPAFPGECGNKPDDARRGMSLRDWFAGQAMVGWLSNPMAMQQLAEEIDSQEIKSERRAITINRVLGKRSYMLADAMLKASEVPDAK